MTSRWPACAALAMWLFACAAAPGASPADAGTGVIDFDPEDVAIAVSGTAQWHPEAIKYLARSGLPTPSLAGLTLRVEEPLKVALNDPLGVFGSVTLTDAGTFSVPNVRVRLVNLALAAGIRDDSDGGARIARSATVLWDVGLEQGKPDRDLVGTRPYAVPSSFHEQLTRSVGATQVRKITDGGVQTLVEAGCIVGQLVDSSGTPVSGARVAPTPASLASQFFYPTEDLASTQAATASSGLFVFVHTGDEVNTFALRVDGHDEYLARTVGAVKNACLLVTVYPGTTAP